MRPIARPTSRLDSARHLLNRRQVRERTLARERVLDTLIGTTIGVVLAVMFSTLDDRAHLARRHEQRTG